MYVSVVHIVSAVLRSMWYCGVSMKVTFDAFILEYQWHPAVPHISSVALYREYYENHEYPQYRKDRIYPIPNLP